MDAIVGKLCLKLTNTGTASYTSFPASNFSSLSPRLFLHPFLSIVFTLFLSPHYHLLSSSPTCLVSSPFPSVLPLLFSSCRSPLHVERIWSHRHSARLSPLHPGDHSSLPSALPPRLQPPSPPLAIHLPIYPSIDCHYSWTPVIPLLVQLGFPFPSHHSAVCVCICVCICVCPPTFVFLPVFLSVTFD